MTIQIRLIKRLYQILAEGAAGECGAIISFSSKIDTEKLFGNFCVFQQEREIFYALRNRGPVPGLRFEGDY